MRSLQRWLGTLAVVLGGAAATHANPYAQPQATCPPPCYAQAPDTCNYGYYAPNCAGTMYGPNYYVKPCFAPYQGPANGSPASRFVEPRLYTHPYARSPRDYWMLDQ